MQQRTELGKKKFRLVDYVIDLEVEEIHKKYRQVGEVGVR